MTRRIAGPYHSTKTRTPNAPAIGHLSTKSSVYSPVSMSRMSQDLVYNHMKSHYQRISSAKACVDTSAPKSMKLTIKEKDRKRKEALLTSRTQRTSSTSGFHAEMNSPREWKRNHPTLNHSSVNDNEKTSFGQRRIDDEGRSFTESPRRPGTASKHVRENGNLQQPYHNHKPSNDTNGFRANEDSMRCNNKTDENSYEQYQRIRRETDIVTRTEPNFTNTDLYSSSPRYRKNRSTLRNETLENNFENTNNEYRTSERLYTSTPRFERRGDFEMDPSLCLSTTTFSYKSPPTQRRPKKKNTGEIVWTEEQKYLQFISDATSDVLARGLCSNRVINKVLESHIEKRRDDLDEEKMRIMIEQLKEDIGVTDD